MSDSSKPAAGPKHGPGDWLPDVHFGTAITPLPEPSLDAEPDPDDEELPVTPADVVWMLGFDPLDEMNDDAEDEED